MKIFETATRRTTYRIFEIFFLTGIVGVIESGQLEALLPAIIIGVLAGIPKAIREFLSAEKNKPINY